MLGDVLGLTPDETIAYSELVAMPSATVADLAAALSPYGTSLGEAHRLLRRLENHGLVARITGDERRFSAAPPAIALGALLARRQDEVRNAEVELNRLEEIYRVAAAGRGPTDVIDVVRGDDAVRHRFEQLQLGARESVDAFVRPPVIVTSSQENSAEDQAVARGVQYRVVVERGMLESQDVTVEETVEATDAGEEVRFAARVPLKLIVVDRELALLPLTSSGDVVGALLVRESTLLDALMALFEIVWEQASPLLLGASGLAGEVADHVDDDDARILGLMLSGLTDQAVAKQLGTSLRTVQRRVRALMDLADVETRVQLGWHAATHGWLRPQAAAAPEYAGA
ncbi:helix-turn-helix domain-containing protein [Promicromonospora thailandica]|uniref:Sugar-specific transcriptional regulator TrmB n=1 Tax=Promicromonospora thailandica TaxID=765201 RepID=A0A9X2JW66_9MICO|nr:helix-turn-helix domain-containing protein [Promicromonospora thailandica]MCP2262804.1 Sugar-specific transcriptional regulator TrmB [Promicromonospora thailandica]BFF18131.1 LuxR family transcriptional regulator [Promicromonospora thailandica]